MRDNWVVGTEGPPDRKVIMTTIDYGTIVLNDMDQPICDVHGLARATDLTSESGSRLYRCPVCRASEWIGV